MFNKVGTHNICIVVFGYAFIIISLNLKKWAASHQN